MTSAQLIERVLSGDARAVARAISLAEDSDRAAAELIGGTFRQTGRAYVIGVTGPPGAGKSTLVDRLVSEIRRTTETRVAVLAVDPSSPFSGGAVLGDRIRMQGHASDDRVFIRSMATRGHLGGLSRATDDAVLLLDAAGYDVVLIETVGVGQAEVDIVSTADVSIVVLVPGLGDDVQALKAGLMEIADIFVVNKADRAESDRLAAAIESALTLRDLPAGEWRPPVVSTVATTGSGVGELLQRIEDYRRFAQSSVGNERSRSSARQRSRHERRLRDLMSRQLVAHVEERVLAAGEWNEVVDRMARRDIDPYAAAGDLIQRIIPVDPRED